MRVDKVKQDKQIIQWRQDSYREILTDINNLKSTYFDIARPDNYLLSQNSFAGYDVTSSNKVSGSAAGVSVEALAGAAVGDYEVKVVRLAAGAKIQDDTVGYTPIKTTEGKDVLRGTKLSELGVTGSVTFSLDYGANGKDGSGNIALPKSYSITASSDMTVQQLMDLVSTKTEGNVKLNYSDLSGKFSMETTKTGEKAELKVGASDLWDKLKLPVVANSVYQGTNSEAKIKSPSSGSEVTVNKEGNSYVIDGVKYTLTVQGSENTVNIKNNVNKPFDKIKGFVDKYNEIIDKIDKKVSEKKQYTYQPLTEEQKEGMKEEEIKRWEDKAKEGLLRGDSNLENMLRELRRAVFDGVKDAGINIKDVGISTSSDTSQKGKLKINDEVLKSALEKTPEKVAKIFIKTSETVSTYSPDLSSGSRNTRWNEEGILNRFNDIFQDYTRTSRNKDGKKGLLIEKAGIKGDLSEFKNSLTKSLDDKDEIIRNLERKLYERENRLYSQFAQLEKAMNQANSQSAWLMQQFGGGA